MDILEVAVRLTKNDPTKTLVKILKRKSIQKFIISLNTDVQLFDQGEDSRGVQLAAIGGGYAPSTIRIKSRKGQPTNRVTLNDTGDLYDSFDITVHANANFTIGADTIKEGTDLQDRYGDKFVGLQKDNIDLVMRRLCEEYFKIIYKGL